MSAKEIVCNTDRKYTDSTPSTVVVTKVKYYSKYRDILYYYGCGQFTWRWYEGQIALEFQFHDSVNFSSLY